MVIIVISSLIFGIIIGNIIIDINIINIFSNISNYTLYILMFSVGISVGINKKVFEKLKKYHIKMLIIPFGIILGSIIGGVFSCIITKIPLNEGISIACGLGWYSLSGVLLTNLSGATIGSIAFLSNIMREIISFIIIPIIAKKFNKYTAIAPAAATSEDTTLPIIIKYTSSDIAIIGVINGIICSTFVPILINFFYTTL